MIDTLSLVMCFLVFLAICGDAIASRELRKTEQEKTKVIIALWHEVKRLNDGSENKWFM